MHGENGNVYRILVGKQKGNGLLEKLNVDGRITLEYT
jgi:hypothetical protein